MKNLLLLVIVTLLLSSCSSHRDPQVVYDDNAKQQEGTIDSMNESSNKHFAGLPFTFDSLEYLYFPIGSTKDDIGVINKSYSRSSNSFSIAFVSGRNVTGTIDNIMIRNKDNDSLKLLSKDQLKIKSLNYLYSIDTIHQIDRFIYQVIDTDTNKDSLLNDDDLVSLYCSKSNGDDFKRISQLNQKLQDWYIINSHGLLYFRTIEDIDRNGIFDKHDRINLYEYNLLNEGSAKLIFNDKVYKELLSD